MRNRRKLIGCPSRAAIPATITFADAPISVPLPPRHAPSDSAHHTGIIASRPPSASSIAFSVGIIVATNGMLSTTADAAADTPRMTYTLFLMLPPVTPTK